MKIIKTPVITEKTLAKYKDENKVTFEIDMDSNKEAASVALEKIYGIKIIDAKVSNRLGKMKYNRLSKTFAKAKDKKIVVFKLAKDSKLDLFETK